MAVLVMAVLVMAVMKVAREAGQGQGDGGHESGIAWAKASACAPSWPALRVTLL